LISWFRALARNQQCAARDELPASTPANAAKFRGIGLSHLAAMISP
jgi:hypothetical protein